MTKFAYEKAENTQHALSLLESRKNAHIYAGGTDVLLKIKHGQLKPGFLVGIGHLGELQYVREDKANNTIHIGAGTKISYLLNNEILHKHASILVRAAREIGSPEVRNMATAGGNICSTSANCGACGLPGCKALSGGSVKPCQYAAFADLILPLMVMDAKLLLLNKEGEKSLALNGFLPRLIKKGIMPQTLLKEICFNKDDRLSRGYARMATSKTMGITLVAVAVSLLKNSDNTCEKMLMAVGGSAMQKPLVVNSIDHLVKNKAIDEEIIERIVAIALPQFSYIDNLQYSRDYTIGRAKGLIAEAIRDAVEA